MCHMCHLFPMWFARWCVLHINVLDHQFTLLTNFPPCSVNLHANSHCTSFSSCFLFRSSPPKLLSKVVVLRFPTVLVVGHGLSYLQKMNCAAFCPSNFQVVISQNIFDWLLNKSTHQRCSIKELLFKILHYSQENTCFGVSF